VWFGKRNVWTIPVTVESQKRTRRIDIYVDNKKRTEAITPNLNERVMDALVKCP